MIIPSHQTIGWCIVYLMMIATRDSIPTNNHEYMKPHDYPSVDTDNQSTIPPSLFTIPSPTTRLNEMRNLAEKDRRLHPRSTDIA